jgi:hypothetical protein
MWTSCSPPFKSSLSTITLTAIRNMDNNIYSMSTSCWKRAAKGPQVSGLTMRGVI